MCYFTGESVTRFALSLFLLCLAIPADHVWAVPSFLTTDESKAEELYNKALDLEVQDKQDKARIYYRDILTRYPDTQTAKAAREKLDGMNAEKSNQAAETLYQQALKYESNRDLNKAWLYYKDVINRYPGTQTALAAQNKLDSLPPSSRYIASADGTAKDIETGLMWMRCSVGQEWDGKTCTGEAKEFTWEAAQEARVNFAGYSDWRMPTVDELRTLIYCSNGKPAKFSMGACEGRAGKDYASPTIVKEIFSSTPFQKERIPNYLLEKAKLADSICFVDGAILFLDSNSKFFVRLVRNP